MSSRDFSDYPREMLDHSHPPGSRKPFSPIAEEDYESLEREESAIKPRPQTIVSPRSSLSPSHSSVSPVSSGSGHSSPHSPSAHSHHPPPPTSQPPPLPTRHPIKPRIPHRGIPQSTHMTKRSQKPYETQHILYPKHNLPTQHSVGQYPYIPRPGVVGQSNSRYPAYENVAPGNAVINSKLPSKMYATQVVTETGPNDRGSPDNRSHADDPGERGSPSGESSPSSTPNSTLGKQIHRQLITDTVKSSSESKLIIEQSVEGGEAGPPAARGTTKVHMGNISLSVKNRPGSAPSTKPKKQDEPLRVLQPPKSSLASRVAQINQNGSLQDTDPKEKSLTPPKPEAAISPVSSKTSLPHTVKKHHSPSSSMEELSNINDEQADQTDGGQVKQDPKTKPQPPHNFPAQYIAYNTGSLSQPNTSGVPHGITQGIMQQAPSLSQQDPRYMYDHRSELAYTHSGLYGAHPTVAFDGTRHHISPPHQYPVQHGYYPGPHEHHVTNLHRGLPPGMQYVRGDPYLSKVARPEHFSKANIGVAHEAACSGDIKTLHRMLSNHEIDAFGCTDQHFTLAHKAALHGKLQVIQFLVESGLPLVALQITDDAFTTPAMLAIQGGSVECLQWLVDEGKVPFQVRDTGGETLMHHAAFHGQVKCLEWLLKTVKKRNESNEVSEIMDESGVSPAHFAAQGGHLDCLQLLMDFGYSVVHTDRENQKPLDWADAMGQNICVRYLMMYETCWALSGELAHMAEQLTLVQKENTQLRDAFAHEKKDHESTISKLVQNHEDKLAKMREHHVDLMASIIHISQDTPSTTPPGTAPNKKNVSPARKAPTDPTKRSTSSRPPIPPDASIKKRPSRRSHDQEKRSHDMFDKGEELEIDYRTATPQEVLEKQMTNVAQRMSASREARKKGGGMTRTFSPLTPIIQRLYNKETEDAKSDRSSRSHRHTERSAPKVKFSTKVTEFPDYSRYDNSRHDNSLEASNEHSRKSTD